MKINKTLIIISLFLVFCISLGTVSATDNNSIKDIQEISILDSVIVENVNEVSAVDGGRNNNQINSLSEGEGSYAELDQAIKNAGDKLILNKSYKYSNEKQYENGIEINKDNFILEGNGFTIDGANLTRAFNVKGANVIIENLNFINCKSDFGGAIYWTGNGGVVSGCNFTDCNATEGGAIYWAGADGSVSGCNFTDCNAANGGGAINCYSVDGSVSGCNFTDCSAGYGGAINWYAFNGSVSGCSFTNCSASQAGGAIYWAVPIDDNVGACNFANCSFVDSSVSGCNFTDCSAIKNGGAIIWFGDNGSVGDCSFTNCNANRTGGAIDWNNGTEGSVSGCSFVDCSAGYGGAIYINSESLSISNCTSTPSVKAPIYNDGTILSDVIITTLNGDVKNVNYGETINLTGTVTTCGMSIAGQELSFKVNGNQINAESDDYGIYSTSYTVDFVGDKNVDATYEGSTGPETVNNGKLISSKVDVIVTVDNVRGKVGDKVKFTAKVNDIYGNPVQGGVVIFGFNGKEYKANVINGVASIEVVLPKAGTYSATAYYDGDENHNNNYGIFAVDVINGSNPNPNPTNKSGIPMEHTGNPLIVLLITLITLPILRRK